MCGYVFEGLVCEDFIPEREWGIVGHMILNIEM